MTLAPAAPTPVGQTSDAFLARPGLAERVILLAALFTYAWATPPEWFVFAADREVESSALAQVLFLFFAVNSVLALNGNWHVVIRTMKREPLIPALVGLFATSALWSTIPLSSLQDGIALSIAYLTAIHLLVRFNPRQIIFMLSLVFSIGAVLNVVFVAAFDDITNIVITPGGDGWNGLSPTKNTLGRATVLGILVCVVQARLTRSFFVWPFFALLNFFLLVGSNSATSFGALVGIAVLSLVLRGFRGRKTLYGATMTAMFMVFSTLTVLSATNLATLTGLVGRDVTFTGRLPLWVDSVTIAIAERPLLGYGFGGFWRHGFVDFEVQLRANFDVPHAHNAWIDSWLHAGPVATLLLTGIFVRGLIWSTRYIRSTPGALGLFPAIVISLGTIFSTTEAGFFNRSISFIIFITAITLAAEQKGRKQPFAQRAERNGHHLDRLALSQ